MSSSASVDFDFVEGFVNEDRTVNVQLRIKDGEDLKEAISEIFKNSKDDKSISINKSVINKIWFKGHDSVTELKQRRDDIINDITESFDRAIENITR